MKKIPDLSHINFTNEIDWTVPRWYINHDNSVVILSTGEHGDGGFTGIALPCKSFPNGVFSKAFSKVYYRPLDFDFAFMVSNSDDESTPESENDE